MKLEKKDLLVWELHEDNGRTYVTLRRMKE
jgi:hypothetical protein